MGGEKLHRFYTKLLAALLAAASLFMGNLTVLSAQTREPLDSVPAAEAVPETEPNPESFIVFNPQEGDEAVSAPGTLSGFAALRMVLVLALTAAAIYGVVFFFRRLAKPPEQASPHLKLLARTPVGSGDSVAVVAVGTRAWLVGVGSGDGGVSLIAEIEDQETVDAMLLDYSQSPERGHAGGSGAPSFSALLRRLGGGGGDKRLGAASLRERRERLNKL
ncbi:MAG: flagellar biosynthetic protein FliO [Treponema sp.]|nr:flagellar biosynthetic protein FliO [Treponema sp.]